MKFGKYLASRQLELPEYSEHFIDYKALKKLIKQLAIPAASNSGDPTRRSSQVEVQETLKENKASFFFRVERELEKVNSLYLEKQANLAVNLDLLIRRKLELFATSKATIEASSSGSAANSNFRNSITFLNLYQNFKKLHQDLVRLQQFIELNETGFSKVVKKWDKRSKSHTKELFILSAVNVQPVFYKNEINELSDLVTQSIFDIEAILDGDYSVLCNSEDSNGMEVLNFARHNSTSSIDVSVSSTATAAAANASAASGNAGAASRKSSLGGVVLASAGAGVIDELYLGFVNIATIEDPSHSILRTWVAKVESTSRTGGGDESAMASGRFSASTRYKLSKIFLLSISNLDISDKFLEAFLEITNYEIDFGFVSEDLNNNRNIFHECSAIAPASAESSQHYVVNNGVKVFSESPNYTRGFIISYIVKHVPSAQLRRILTCKDYNGRTGLHYASQYGRVDILDIVLPVFPRDHIDDLDNESKSPVLLAIRHNHLEVVKLLAHEGSNLLPPTDESKLQYLPINYACKFGNYDILEYILSQSGDDVSRVNQQDVEGLLPLHVLARGGHSTLISLLIAHGADVNQPDNLNDWTPIFYAALEGRVAAARKLVEVGARLDLLDLNGFNVLYYCVVDGHINVLNELLNFRNRGFGTANPHADSNASANAAFSEVVVMKDVDDSEDSGNLATGAAGDSIPHLLLPPPILPLRRYGHNFLEQKVLIELVFSSNLEGIELFNSAKGLNAGRITLTSNLSDMVPRNILQLSTEDASKVSNCIFQIDLDSLPEFRLDVEVFPKFGTRLIAKTTALSFSEADALSPEMKALRLPLFDLRLKNVGVIKFDFQVIFPFSGTLLDTSKFDTYWKSATSVVNKRVTKTGSGSGVRSNVLSPSSVISGVGANVGSAIAGSNATNASNASNAAKGNKASNAANAANGAGDAGNSSAVARDSGKDTYVSSFVTATSLLGQYLCVKVCLLNDGTPVVCPHWSIGIMDNIELFLPNLTLDELLSVTNYLFDYEQVIKDLSQLTVKDLSMIKKLLKIIFMPLDILLEVLNVDINLSLEFIFPSVYELERLPFVGNTLLNLNNFIDFTLNDVFNHVRARKLRNQLGRSIVFLSSNALICKILNWKQPYFPVFLSMSGFAYNSEAGRFEPRSANGLALDCGGSENGANGAGTSDGEELPSAEDVLSLRDPSHDSTLAHYQETAIRSIKEAINFTVSNNLLGVIISQQLLDLVPRLVPLFKSRGIVLVASDNATLEDAIGFEGVSSGTLPEINGLRRDDVLTFKEGISM